MSNFSNEEENVRCGGVYFSSSWESGGRIELCESHPLPPPPFYPSVMMDVFFFFLLSLDYTTC